jgi:predicted RNA binding protein YcfA (HicA-like mRNA interferase family)
VERIAEVAALFAWMKVRDVIKMIEKDGWRLKRTSGSHRQFVHPWKPGKVMVAGHPGKDMHPDTFRAILRQGGIQK